MEGESGLGWEVGAGEEVEGVMERRGRERTRRPVGGGVEGQNFVGGGVDGKQRFFSHPHPHPTFSVQ